MNAHELKKELENATQEYNDLEIEYRQHILKYGISLIGAELAVVGFLLQNTTTQLIMSHFWAKFFLLSSLLATLLSVVLNILAKRVGVGANKYLMHSYQFRAFSKTEEIDITISGIEIPASMVEGADKKADDAVHKYMKAAKKVRPLLNWSEYAIISGLTFSVFLVIYLITSF